MPTRTSLPTDETVFAAVEQFVQQALADGCNPAVLSCALTVLTVRIGLLVTAVNAASSECGASQTSQDADLDPVTKSCGGAMRFKRKSDHDRRAAERQRSSASRDVSALQSVFRRCHSDSEFRARFIANCRNP
jgi:hypothetical protein